MNTSESNKAHDGRLSMKYSIEGFGQERAVELGLTAEDLVLLRWFVDFYGTGKMVKHLLPDGVYAWVNYKTVLEQLPIIKCNKRNLATRFERLVAAGVLTHKTIKQGGTFAVYGFGPKYDGLIYEQPTSEIGLPPRLNSDHPHVQIQTTPTSEIGRTKIILQEDYSIKDSSIKDKKKNVTALASDDIETEFKHLWELYPRKQGKANALKAYTKARKGHPDVYKAVESGIRAYAEWIAANKVGAQYIKQGSTWFNQHCWEDDYTTGGDNNGETARHDGAAGYDWDSIGINL